MSRTKVWHFVSLRTQPVLGVVLVALTIEHPYQYCGGLRWWLPLTPHTKQFEHLNQLFLYIFFISNKTISLINLLTRDQHHVTIKPILNTNELILEHQNYRLKMPQMSLNPLPLAKYFVCCLWMEISIISFEYAIHPEVQSVLLMPPLKGRSKIMSRSRDCWLKAAAHHHNSKLCKM